MEDVLIFAIPVLALGIGLIAVIKMPRRAFGGAPRTDLEARVQALEQEVGGLRQELGETQERLDFAERLLTKAKETGRLNQEPG